MNDRVEVGDEAPPERLPLALLAEDRDERTQWLARLLEEARYAVLRERTARHAEQRARAAQPDLLILAADLPDEAGGGPCRRLPGHPRITQAPPVFLTPSE